MVDLPHAHVAPEGPARAHLAWLHSNGMSGSFYLPLAKRLAQRGLATTLFDLPGFAGAPAPATRGWPGLLEATAIAIRTHVGPEPVLVGHSLGGLVALMLAERVRPRAVVLLEPAIVPHRWLARLAAALYVRRVFDGPTAFRNRGPWFWRLADPDGFPNAWIQHVQDNHARADRRQVTAMHRELPSLYPLPFGALDMPVLLLRGACSGPVMAWGQRDLARRLPDARAITVPGAGHWLANEQDAALSQAIDGFLREEGVRSPP